ncbi:MAG: radical SAM protein [Nanoarchaeota archaeon]
MISSNQDQTFNQDRTSFIPSPRSANHYHSYNYGELPQGCQYCVRGEKLVYFVTGLCPRKCSFCPVSDEKFGQDITFANERKVFSEQELLLEANVMTAKGAGITGGDPLARLPRTIAFIRLMKQQYGKQFHIHLYTSLNLVTEQALQQLYDAGLDEIRFHLDLESEQFWSRLLLAKKFPWKIGVELPVIPGQEPEQKKVINYIHGNIDFLVLNELEVADNRQSTLLQQGFTTKDQWSYAVKGSLEAGQELLDYIQRQGYSFSAHLCTARLKDKVQLGNRLRREAQGARKKFDQVDEEGLLTRGALYLPELVPGFGYRKKLEACNKLEASNKFNKPELLERLRSLLSMIKEDCRLTNEEIFLDREKPRILLSAKKIKPLQKKFRRWGLIPAIVKEYPTADQLEIEVELFGGDGVGGRRSWN